MIKVHNHKYRVGTILRGSKSDGGDPNHYRIVAASRTDKFGKPLYDVINIKDGDEHTGISEETIDHYNTTPICTLDSALFEL